MVPSTWNAGPRDENDEPGPYEASLLDNPIADPEKPLEVIRTIHSFDPCLACAIHMVDTRKQQEVVRVHAVGSQWGLGYGCLQPNSKQSRWFRERYAEGNKRMRKIGIVGVARRLLIDLWRYLEDGVVPEGATLRQV